MEAAMITIGKLDPGMQLDGHENCEPLSHALVAVESNQALHATREEWLDKALELLKPSIEVATACRLPQVRLACGFPSKGALAKKRVIGQCWGTEAVNQTIAYIFISPLIDDPVIVLGTLLHEACHAALPPKTKHKKAFADSIHRLGLEGKATADHVGEALAKRLNDEIIPLLGPYPHKAWALSAKEAKQTTRLRLYVCECPVKVRVASDNFEAHCDLCNGKFTKVEKGE